MEVTSEKRREVANRLRAAHVTDTFAGTYARYSDLNSEFVWRLVEALADVDGERLHHEPHGFNRRQLMDTLADLIDRPTRGSKSNDGYSCAGGWRYCPNCGAEVAHGEG